MSIGLPGLILIVLILLIIFGPTKLPALGSALGQSLKEFKNSTKDLNEDDDDSKKTINHQ